jgi:SAM-dependent methyltransferase
MAECSKAPRYSSKNPSAMKSSNFDPKRLVANSYDQIAERYLEWRTKQRPEGAAPWMAILRKHLQPGSKLLDLGCGAGIPLTRALAEAFDVTGVDFSASQIDLARPNVPNALFINADFTALDFPPASFDAAVGSHSFFHVPRAEHEALFCKIAVWLKPGGFLLANFGIGNCEIDYEEDWLGVPMFWSSFDAKGERTALTSAGFELLVDRIDTEIEDGRPHRWLVVLARSSSPDWKT